MVLAHNPILVLITLYCKMKINLAFIKSTKPKCKELANEHREDKTVSYLVVSFQHPFKHHLIKIEYLAPSIQN